LNSIYCEIHRKEAKQHQQLYYAKTVADPNRNLTPEKARARIETCRARIRKNEARIAELEEYLQIRIRSRAKQISPVFNFLGNLQTAEEMPTLTSNYRFAGKLANLKTVKLC
jgi:hypothetical protein